MEWSVTVMGIVLTTSPMELVWDSLAVSASAQWRRCITQKQEYLSWSGRLVAFLLMKVVSCRYASGLLRSCIDSDGNE
jgi:threonine/homoserine/homoserine lactone efflux protein